MFYMPWPFISRYLRIHFLRIRIPLNHNTVISFIKLNSDTTLWSNPIFFFSSWPNNVLCTLPCCGNGWSLVSDIAVLCFFTLHKSGTFLYLFIFFVFEDVGMFFLEVKTTSSLKNALHFGFVWCFCVLRCKLCIPGLTFEAHLEAESAASHCDVSFNHPPLKRLLQTTHMPWSSSTSPSKLSNYRCLSLDPVFAPVVAKW